MSEGPGEPQVLDNPAPPETAWRDALKRVLWRLLPTGLYQRLLGYSKSRDFASGRFREPELDLVGALVHPDETAVDVGANHGMWTLAMSRAAGERGRVHAFEPVPFTFGTLKVVLRRDGVANATLYNKGCADRPGVLDFVIPRQRSGSSDDLQAHLSARDSAESGDEAAAADTVACEITTLDGALDGVQGVSLLKLDIEGAELLALKGSTELIERERPAIVCEVDADFLAGFDQRPADVFEFLRGWGYEPYRYDGDSRRLDPIPDPQRIAHANVIFLTEAHHQRLRDFWA